MGNPQLPIDPAHTAETREGRPGPHPPPPPCPECGGPFHEPGSVVRWHRPDCSRGQRGALEALKAADTVRLFEAFVAGFKASGEGWNGEYPYADRGVDPGTDLAPHFMEWLTQSDGSSDE